MTVRKKKVSRKVGKKKTCRVPEKRARRVTKKKVRSNPRGLHSKPKGSRYMIVAHSFTGHGKELQQWYFSGSAFDDKRAKAEIFPNQNAANEALRSLKSHLPKEIASARVVEL